MLGVAIIIIQLEKMSQGNVTGRHQPRLIEELQEATAKFFADRTKEAAKRSDAAIKSLESDLRVEASHGRSDYTFRVKTVDSNFSNAIIKDVHQWALSHGLKVQSVGQTLHCDQQGLVLSWSQ